MNCAELVAKRLDCAGFSGAFGRTIILVKRLHDGVQRAVLKPPQSRRFAPSGCHCEFFVLEHAPVFPDNITGRLCQ